MNIKLCTKCGKYPAAIFIQKIEGDKSFNEGLCLQCAAKLNMGPINQMLKDNLNISDDDLEAMNEQIASMMEGMVPADDAEGDDFTVGGAPAFPFLNKIFDTAPVLKPEEKQKASEKEKDKTKDKEKEKINKKRKMLETYGTNLTRRAKAGELDIIVGRENELYRVIQILSRRSKNNPCLIGEPGVGKTAIAEGLALKIANGTVPARLLNKEIYLLDLTALVAGTQFRGQFESRVKGLISEVRDQGNIILFIDEIHNLVGVGDSEGSMNAANILKPALSRGEVQVIGATTFNEYRKHIEKDAALERRFQPVTIEEPSIEQTVTLLMGVKEYYEKHHSVNVDGNMLYQIVTLAERYITDRFMPDKAIDLLDEACACASLKNIKADEYNKLMMEIDVLIEEKADIEENAELGAEDYERLAIINSDLAKHQKALSAIGTEVPLANLVFDDIARVIELWTGIPASKIKESDLKKLSRLEDALKKKIIGQDPAVEKVANAVRRSRVQINTRRRPSSFIFVGPTGVGKTELVKVLADELFNTPETLIRLDMSEFMEKHAVSRIIGAPPGYIGYDEAGQLTEKIRRKPYSVILLDEIEKAHPDVLNILLGILDDGKVSDAHGRVVNFENTIIVMTSNAGSENKDKALGFGKSQAEDNEEKAIKALEEVMRPEFIGRVGEIVVFSELSTDSMEKIAGLMLEEMSEPLKMRGIELKYDIKAEKALVEKLSLNKRGARELRNIIRREVEDKIASEIVNSCDEMPKTIVITAINAALKINF